MDGRLHRPSSGAAAAPRLITVVELLVIHDRVVEQTGGSLGVRDPGALASAIARPNAGFGEDEAYPTPVAKAAAILEAVCNLHPFVDGNKRTALLAAALLLHRAGLELEVPLDDGERLMIDVASGLRDVDAIGKRLERWIC